MLATLRATTLSEEEHVEDWRLPIFKDFTPDYFWFRSDVIGEKEGFGFSGNWTVNDQKDLLAYLFGLQETDKARKR